MIARAAVVVLLLALGGTATAAVDVPATYVLAIGYNGVPAGSDTLKELRFADDDAAAVATFTSSIAAHVELLTTMDADTQRRHRGLAATTHPPTLAELQRAVASLRKRIDADRAAGRATSLVVFYSGHGFRSDDGPTALVLDGDVLTRERLYTEILEPLRADRVHLLIDACYAEDVVRPRDVDAQRVRVTPALEQALAESTTLKRFPNVGTLIATSSSEQAFEWDAIHSGVFSYVLLSGLRGAADVDGDGRIEYSELAAFFTAATRSIANPRARPTLIAFPPQTDRRSVVLDLRAARGQARLTELEAKLGRISVEDGLGNHLADLTVEGGHRAYVMVPAGQSLFVSAGGRSTRVVLAANEARGASTLSFHDADSRPRGALSDALREGLFALGFGPRYYVGFVDSAPQMIGVPLDRPLQLDAPPPVSSWRSRSKWVWGATGAFLVSTIVLTALTLDARSTYANTDIEREAAAARERFQLYRGLAFGAGALTAATGGIALWLTLRNDDPLLSRDRTFGVGAAFAF